MLARHLKKLCADNYIYMLYNQKSRGIHVINRHTASKHNEKCFFNKIFHIRKFINRRIFANFFDHKIEIT